MIIIGASLSEPHIDWHNGPRGGECIYQSIYLSRGSVCPFQSIWRGPYCSIVCEAHEGSNWDCTFFHNYLTFFHNSTAKWPTRRFAFPSRFSMNHDAPGALISDTVTDAAARTRSLSRERKRRQRELEERHHCYSAHIIPRCITLHYK